MPSPSFNADEMSKISAAGDPRAIWNRSVAGRTRKAVRQRGCDGARARRHPEPETVVVIERLRATRSANKNMDQGEVTAAIGSCGNIIQLLNVWSSAFRRIFHM